MKPISADDGERIGRLSSCVIQAFSWLLLLSEPRASLPFTPPYMFWMLAHSPDFLIPEVKRTCR